MDTDKPGKRLRFQHFVVQPVFVLDDGDELVPGPVIEPQPLTLAGLRDIAETWPEKLAELQAQHDAATPASRQEG